MYIIVNKQGKYLTNYGMSKFWFIDNIEFAYRFENIDDAIKMSEIYDAELKTIK